MTATAVIAQRVLVQRTWLTPARRRAAFHGLVLVSAFFSILNYIYWATSGPIGEDAYAYWIVGTTGPYTGTYGDTGFFPYSPPLALIASTFAALPWPAFLGAWFALLLAVLRWLAGSWRTFALLALFLPVSDELPLGNVNLLIGAAIVLGFRWPAAWAFVLLTKVTPGIALIWFAVRREWRSLSVALGATLAIALASAALAPQLWADWLLVLTTHEQPPSPFPPLWARLPVAAAVVAWGALSNRRWTVPVAAVIAVPVVWFATLAILAAIPALNRAGTHAQHTSQSRP